MKQVPVRGADAVIIGAGVIGTAIGLELSRRGRHTVNVDFATAPGHGSTSSSAGIVRVYAASRDAAAMAQESLHYWHDWASYLDLNRDEPRVTFRTCGSLILDPGSEYRAAVVRTLSELGARYEQWSTDELRHHLPFLDARSFGPPHRVEDERFWGDPNGVLTGGLFQPDSGYVSDPALAAENLRSAAVRLGAQFRFGVRVQAILQSRGRVNGVQLSDGSCVQAPVVVNAAGPLSSKINAMAHVLEGMTVRTRPLRQELHHVPCPSDLDYPTRGVHIADADLGINFRPETGHAILVGSNGAACDSLDYVEDAENFDTAVSSYRWQTQTLRLARRIPAIGVPSRRTGVVGLYDVTQDWVPIYDKSDLPGFFLAIGTSGNQFKNAPVVGQVMATLIEECESGRDHDATPLVFHTRHTGVDIETSAYSRRRPISVENVVGVNG